MARLQICYSVIATLPDEPTARDYIGWLRDGHLDAVVAGGASSGMIVRLTDPPPGGPPGAVRVMTQYVFPDRPAFDQYVANVAPALRAEGLARFGPERGVTFARLVGEII